MEDKLLKEIRERHAQAKKEVEGFDEGTTSSFYTCEEGDNKMRFLPHWETPGKARFWTEGHVHFNVGPNNDAVVCVRKMHNEDCPVCDYMEELLNSGEKKAGKRIAPKFRAYFNIIDLNDPGKGPQPFSCGIRLFAQIISFYSDGKWGDITDFEKGQDFIIERMGTGLKTKYSMKPDGRETTAVANKEDVLAAMTDLSIFTASPDADRVKTIMSTLSGTSSDEGDGDEVDDEGPSTPAKEEKTPEKKEDKKDKKPPKPQCFSEKNEKTGEWMWDPDNEFCQKCIYLEECGVDTKKKQEAETPKKEAPEKEEKDSGGRTPV